MLEVTIKNYLENKIDKTVCVEKPEATSEYCLLYKSGDRSVSKGIYSCYLMVQSYSTSVYKASVLNESVVEAMSEITELDIISSCEVNAGGLYTDTKSKNARYQTTFYITYFRR